jgi:hypothetical protein
MKSETKNWPHEIINFLYKHYSETWTELNRFLYTELKLEKHNTTHKDKIRELLDQLEDKGYLKWIANNMNDKNQSIDANYRETFKNITDEGLDAARIEARLTLDGLDYAIELEREKQKHNIYKWATPLGTFFAFLAFFVSLLTYIRGCNTNANGQASNVEIQLSEQEPQTPKSSGTKLHKDSMRTLQSVEITLPKHDTTTTEPK